MSAPDTLHELQSWLFDRVLATAVDPAAAQRIASGALPATQRLEIYRHGYLARLTECLEDDYPALRHALGPAHFSELCRAFIHAHPPRSPSLNYYGAPFAQFIAARSERWCLPAAELAQLEWAIVEAIHAEEGERLDPSALGRLPPDDWARARLLPSPSLRLIETTHAVANHYQAFQEGSVPSGQWPAPGESAVAVCRREADVWRVRIEPALAQLLASLLAGMPLLAAIERCTGGTHGTDPHGTDPHGTDPHGTDPHGTDPHGTDPHGTRAAADKARVTPDELQRAFRDWVSCGMFARLALD